MAAYRRVYDYITCRLTAKNRDQLRNLALGSRLVCMSHPSRAFQVAIRFDSLCDSIRIDSFCKNNRPFDSLVVMQFFLLKAYLLYSLCH